MPRLASFFGLVTVLIINLSLSDGESKLIDFGLFNPFVILFRLGLNDHCNVWPAFVPMTLGPMRIYDHEAKYFAHSQSLFWTHNNVWIYNTGTVDKGVIKLRFSLYSEV